MKIIFMGTPEFSVTILSALTGKHEIALAVTQPDRPKGRGKKLCPPPVKEYALAHDIPVLQPERIRGDVFFSLLREISPDAIVVAAFGMILPVRVLEFPRFGCINVHTSLLPKYRGAAPVQWAVMNGETVTGVTIMRMDKGIDTGDIILMKEQPICESDTAGTLLDKLAILGADALIESLELIEAGKADMQKQDDSASSYAPMLDSETGRIDWNNSRVNIINKVRGLYPEPGAYFRHRGQAIKLLGAEYAVCDIAAEPGKAIAIIKNKGFVIGCSDGGVLATKIQAPGGKIMGAADYLRGHELLIGERLD